MSANDQLRLVPTGEPPARGGRLVLGTITGYGPAPRSLIDISHRLRPRDYTIAALLDEHTTLTTDQLTAVLFAHPTTCRHRLHQLRTLTFVDRFIRNQPGAANATCWTPGLLSARWAALARGDSPPTARMVRIRQDRVYASPTLAHQLSTNQFFVDLLAHARGHPETGLLRWWSEQNTAAAFGQRIRPDGHGIWRSRDRTVGFHLELDRGTEPLSRLVGRLAAHRLLQAEGGPQYPLLFMLPSRAREQHLHRRLAEACEPTLTIATSCPQAGPNPAGPVWRVAGNGRHRLPLAELPSRHGQPGILNPGPPTGEDDPLRLLHR
ncbi:hypothetical protein GCM10023170_097100 [Phytohabitans houttuyneae]